MPSLSCAVIQMRDGNLANALGSAATAKISALKKFKNIIIKK